MGAAKKKGRSSSDTFEVGDEIRIQDSSTKKWNKIGTIKEKREADDNQEVSFVIELQNGRETIRHRSHIRHNVTRYTQVTDTRVRFSFTGDKTKNTVEEDTKEDEKKKRGRPRKGKEKDRETDDTIGVASRTWSRTSLPDSTALPSKSCLKKRAHSS